jgi:hypothetical protein
MAFAMHPPANILTAGETAKSNTAAYKLPYMKAGKKDFLAGTGGCG